MNAKFYIAPKTKEVVEVVNGTDAVITFAGEEMKALTANTTEAATEKHIPVVTVEGDKVTVMVGSVTHPMLPEHYIEWIQLETENGSQRKMLKPGEAPAAVFTVTDDKPVAVYAYCNLHGLWAAEL